MKLARTNDLLNVMALKSEELQHLIADAGIARGDGIRLVSRLARENRLRDWPDTQTPEDYDTLIACVSCHLRGTP